MVDLTKAPRVGETFTTARTKVTGKVVEIVENPSGSLRVKLELPDGATRWTTAKAPHE